MNKKLFVISSLLLAMASSTAEADPISGDTAFNLLSKDVVKSFLQKANNPNSLIHKKLENLNQENTDGRNEHGIFPKILRESDIKIILINGEDDYGRYCYAITGKPGHLRCENGVSATYLIILPYIIQVHKATEYQSLIFTISAAKSSQSKLDENEREYDRRDSIKIDEPLEAPLSPK